MGLNRNPSMVVRSGISQVFSLWTPDHIKKVSATMANTVNIAKKIFAMVDILPPLHRVFFLQAAFSPCGDRGRATP
jgi:hypothetical protein